MSAYGCQLYWDAAAVSSFTGQGFSPNRLVVLVCPVFVVVLKVCVTLLHTSKLAGLSPNLIHILKPRACLEASVDQHDVEGQCRSRNSIQMV